MNRRSFLASLIGGLALAVVPIRAADARLKFGTYAEAEAHIRTIYPKARYHPMQHHMILDDDARVMTHILDWLDLPDDGSYWWRVHYKPHIGRTDVWRKF